jgi:tight adherence protein B
MDRALLHRLGFSDCVSAPEPAVALASAPKEFATNHLSFLEELLFEAGIEGNAITLVSVAGAIFVAVVAFGSLVLSLHAVLLFASLFAAIPFAYLVVRRNRRLHQMAQQLPYVLDLLRSALESGHTVGRGLQMAVTNISEPMAGLLHKVVDQTALGVPLPDAMESVFRRFALEELVFLISAVRMQSEVGSGLSEILGHVGQSLRNRQRIESQILALTAQARLGATIVSVLPAAVIIIMSMIQPGYAAPLFDSQRGFQLLEIAATLDVVSWLLMRHLSKVNY